MDELMDEARPIATVDVALFTLREGTLSVGLMRRENAPFAGAWALPGGFVHVDDDEDAAATARRVLLEKCGIAPRYLEQLYTFTGRARDPRDWSISIAYYALVSDDQLRSETLRIVPAQHVPMLAFDHERIVAAAVERIRGKSTYSALPAYLLPSEFTVGDLHEVYEQATGHRLDRVSFRRKIEEQGIIEPMAASRRGGAHRPAQLYRLSERALRPFERKI